MTRNHLGAQRQLVRSQPQCFAGFLVSDAFHLEQDLSRTHDRDPVVGRALAFTHTGFSRLLRDRLIRKQAQPDFAATLDETRHRHAAGFDLAVGDPTGLEHFEPEIAEREFGTAPRFAAHASALLLAVLNFLWHQHKSVSCFLFPFRTRPNRARLAAVAARRPSWCRGSRLCRSSTSRRSHRTWSSLRRIRIQCPRAACAAAGGLAGTTPSARSRCRSSGPTRAPWCLCSRSAAPNPPTCAS